MLRLAFSSFLCSFPCCFLTLLIALLPAFPSVSIAISLCASRRMSLPLFLSSCLISSPHHPASPPLPFLSSRSLSACCVCLSLAAGPSMVPSPTASLAPRRPVRVVSSSPSLVCLPVTLSVSRPVFREGSRDLRAADRASCGCGRP